MDISFNWLIIKYLIMNREKNLFLLQYLRY